MSGALPPGAAEARFEQRHLARLGMPVAPLPAPGLPAFPEPMDGLTGEQERDRFIAHQRARVASGAVKVHGPGDDDERAGLRALLLSAGHLAGALDHAGWPPGMIGLAVRGLARDAVGGDGNLAGLAASLAGIEAIDGPAGDLAHFGADAVPLADLAGFRARASAAAVLRRARGAGLQLVRRASRPGVQEAGRALGQARGRRGSSATGARAAGRVMPDEADLFPLRERIAADIARRAAIVAGAQDWREAAALLHQAGELTTSTARALGVVPLVEARLGAEMKAAVEAKNECELVVLLAEARIGAELQAAQDRGEVAAREDNLRRGPKSEARTSEKATLPDIGIPRQRAAEMKKLAEARN